MSRKKKTAAAKPAAVKTDEALVMSIHVALSVLKSSVDEARAAGLEIELRQGGRLVQTRPH